MSDPSKEQAVAREQVMKCEQEIQSIKSALRRLGSADNADAPNSVEICMLKVEGLPEGAQPILSLQLSSPVEEATLSAIYDPLNADPAPEGCIASFEGVETSMATLVATAKDADIPLGSSAPHELAPLCLLDAMEVKEKYVSEIPVAIVAEGAASAEVAEVVVEATNEEEKPDTVGGDKDAVAEAVSEGQEEEAKPDGETPATSEPAAESETKSEPQEAAAVPLQPICTITLRVTYKPSPKDQREELYELLNKTSQRKAAALENLRKISTALARSGESSSPSKSMSSAMTKPAVKSGFLNKKKKEKEPTKFEKLYERTIGPNSMLMKAYGITLAAKNFLIFFGAVGFFHFKGQLLALPPPA
eukprot:CAMPEP_0117030862 /NCGR_PEP_ID=MMETSP0472-20121206/22243_1 /TAXON_ID=693140 ORGANISM="Tiarina fusus, Strain LIS" /NCGR_SAMPLE_ID=MMETSP0472 /ASSEMBLY_ACC=CAM_ASM_000603 /LENGTH=360 /DNA_ID=CAMNT_0004739057 /DNA_START=112 /DNA_END=1194 /DNA_ORIENTATION=-